MGFIFYHSRNKHMDGPTILEASDLNIRGHRFNGKHNFVLVVTVTLAHIVYLYITIFMRERVGKTSHYRVDQLLSKETQNNLVTP